MNRLRKQICLYFNLNDSDELELWEYIKDKKHNKFIKQLIYDHMRGIPSSGLNSNKPNNSIDITAEDDLSNVIC